jgi:Zn-dependent protease
VEALGTSQAVQLTVLTLVLFFGGILLHEAAHALAARSFDLPVRAITLVFWGGATETRSWRKGPLADFVVAAAGPMTTAALGVTFKVVAGFLQPGDLQNVFEYLGRINLLFEAFNAIPGFPLDGGRMLMAVAWWITRQRALAFRIAGIGSMLIGGGLIAFAIYDLGSKNGQGWWLLAGYLGFVMITVGRQIPSRAVLRERLSRGTARDAMRPVTDPIPIDATIYEATERWLRPFPTRAFPVADTGGIVGTISFEEVRDRSAALSVGTAMVPLSSPPETVDADEPLDDVVEWIGSRDALVRDDGGGTVGIIAVEDVEAWMKRRWNTEEFVEPTSVALPPRPDTEPDGGVGAPQ